MFRRVREQLGVAWLIVRGGAVLLLSLLLCSCGGGQGGNSSEGALPTTFLEEGGGGNRIGGSEVPIVSVSKAVEGFTYRVHGNTVTEEELMMLMSRLQSFSEGMLVLVAPDASVSSDEANLVASKIRATGLRNTRVERQ